MATRKVPGVLASFVHIDAATDAIASLRGQGRRDFTVYSAAPNHEIEEALGITNSPVRLFTLFGGLTGCAAGFGMTIWMSRDWPLLVGGKPIAPIPPYVVMGFELMVLIGALSTVAGMIFLAARNSTRGLAYHPSFSDDRIGIFVPAAADQAGAVVELLRHAGATEVRHEA
jgi:hypothetical protein